ncbi:MAG: hypothetical protein K2Z80_25105 [Xanthobacteraceae bacterium]|nr:hypothetical protein [Xanthobacteraceae bacterium]
MPHTIFRTSQALHFDVAGHCFVAGQSADGRAPQNMREEHEPGTLLPFLSLLLGIAVSADAGHAS